MWLQLKELHKVSKRRSQQEQQLCQQSHWNHQQLSISISIISSRSSIQPGECSQKDIELVRSCQDSCAVDDIVQGNTQTGDNKLNPVTRHQHSRSAQFEFQAVWRPSQAFAILQNFDVAYAVRLASPCVSHVQHTWCCFSAHLYNTDTGLCAACIKQMHFCALPLSSRK